MAKYGSFKYGEEKYGAMQVLLFKIASSLNVPKGMTYLKEIVFNIKVGLTRLNVTNKNILFSVKTLHSVVKQANKFISMGMSAVSSMLKQTGKTVLFTIKGDTPVSKQTGKIISMRIKTTHAASKQINKVVAFVLGFLSKMFWYKPLYPHLEYTEYLIDMECVDYTILLEVVGMPFVGSTITLKGTFPDSAGNLVQLEDVTLKVYAPGKVLNETITPVEVSTGLYSGDYTIPEDKTGQFDYEFSGVLGDKTIVGRSSFHAIWR